MKKILFAILMTLLISLEFFILPIFFKWYLNFINEEKLPLMPVVSCFILAFTQLGFLYVSWERAYNEYIEKSN